MNKKFYMTHANLIVILTFLSIIGLATVSPEFAQPVKTGTSISKNEVVFTHNASLDQCRNGPQVTPEGCAGDSWANGDLNGSQAHYIEGQSVPYRILFGNFTVPGPHSVTIEWDTSENSLHAIDYLTTFKRTEVTANPCFGIADCDPAAYATYPIPLDPNVASEGVTQVPGVFTFYGGTITGVSAYVVAGTLDTTSHTSITITFTVTRTNPVLAWGGHIATRADWGQNHSAVSISGAPYHMRILDVDGEGGGNQDRSLQSSAVIYPSTVSIIKTVQTYQGGDSSMTYFPFTATNFIPTAFQLRDVNDSAQDRVVNSNIMHFGVSNAIVVTESPASTWSLSDLTCVETSGGGTSIPNSTTDLGTATATIIVEEGEIVTCTFHNLQLVPTAATAALTGRVMTEGGYGIMGATLTLTNLSDGAMKSARSNAFGYFTIDGIPIAETYMLTVTHKRFTFMNNSLTIVIMDDLEGVNFVASLD